MPFQKHICRPQSNNPEKHVSPEAGAATRALVTTISASGPLPFFQFRPRLEKVDWRRLGAIDVDKVVGTMDVLTLQENITNITFCKLEDEKCPYCQLGVDPLLLKLIRMAQLTIEYLIHSQEFLTSQLRMVEERLHLSLSGSEENKQLLTKQADEIRQLKQECRHRKKMLSAQQLMMGQAKASRYECHLCDKAFMNQAFLQSHIHRRHPAHSCLGRNAKAQNEKLQKEIDMLKEQLQITKSQLKSAQQTHISKDDEVQKTNEKDLQKLVRRWEEEEKQKLVEEMEKVKEKFMKEFKDLTAKNSALEYQLFEIRNPVRRAGSTWAPGETPLGLRINFCTPAFPKYATPTSVQGSQWSDGFQGLKEESSRSSVRSFSGTHSCSEVMCGTAVRSRRHCFAAFSYSLSSFLLHVVC